MRRFARTFIQNILWFATSFLMLYLLLIFVVGCDNKIGDTVLKIVLGTQEFLPFKIKLNYNLNISRMLRLW